MTNDNAHVTFSRRNMLMLAATGAGVIALGTFARAKASTKVSQKAVSYRPTPSGKARCDNCLQWEAPAGCKVVSGTISPAGWCSIYAPK